MENNWTDKMRKRMENYEEPAPEGLWDDIERVMKARNTPVTIQQVKHRSWQRIAAVAATLAIAITCTLFLLIHTDNLTPRTPDSPATASVPRQQPEMPSLQQPTEPSFVAATGNAPRIASVHRSTQPYAPTTTTTDDVTTTTPLADEPRQHTAVTPDTTSRHYETPIRLTPAQEDNSLPVTHHITPNRSKRNFAQWRASVFVSNVTPGSNITSGYAQLSAPNNAAQAPAQYANENAMLPMMSIIRFNANEPCNTETKHSQPIRTGFTVRYNIDRRWSIESGVTYTMLHSQLQSGSENYYYLSNQTLHYIGVPVKVNFNIWENRWFLFYVSGGMMIEKCVNGDITTDYVMNDRATSDTEPISTKPLQWSLNAAVGAQFNILPQLGLYVEPGGSFYFDDGTTIENIYKEKPLNFSIELGLRVSIR